MECYMTPKQVAQRLGSSVNHAKRVMREIGAVNIGVGGSIVLRILPTELQEWEKSRQVVMVDNAIIPPPPKPKRRKATAYDADWRKPLERRR